MTIEKAPPSAPASKPSASPHAPAAKPKSASAEAASDAKGAAGAGDAAGAGGFLAILGALSALGDGAGDATAAADTALPALALPDPSAAALPIDATNVPMDAATLLLQNPQIGQQANRAGADGSAVAQDPNANLLGNTPPTAAPTAPPAKLPADAASAARKALPGAAGDKSTDALAAQAAESLTKGLQNASSRANSHARAALDLAAAHASQANSTAAQAAQAAEPKDTKLLVALEQARAQFAARAPEPVFVPLLAKAEKPLNERSSYAAKSAEPGYAGTSLGLSSPDTALNAAQAVLPTTEAQVAEQVTYWVTQNVQNAELTLDGLGELPVEVSIQVQGNEAQITFRSDEAATRGVLEAASAQLKDLLQREGMVLTGVSVGAGGSGDAQGGQRQPRQGVRQGLIAPLQPVVVETGRRMPMEAGRSVDLFV